MPTSNGEAPGAVSVSDLVTSHRAGRGLERVFYQSDEIFELELKRIFMRQWLLVGPVCRIRNPGDYFLYSVAGESIIIIRDRSGEVHGLFNVCRHRGSRICLQEAGNAKMLVCPYHNWVYNPDGSLAAVRHMPDDFDKSNFGLARCHLRVFHGLIFVSLADVPPDFEPMARDLGSYLEPLGLDHTKVCRRLRYEVKANWKLVAENSWECYHCGPAHPEFGSVMSYVAAMDSSRAAEERKSFEKEWESSETQRSRVTGGVNLTPTSWYYCARLPIRPGFLSQSRDGRPVAPLMGNLTQHDGGITAFALRPFTFFVASNDHAVLSRFVPIDPGLTEIEMTWLVHEGAVEGVDYDVDRVTWLWRVTTEQDVRLCENNQAGVNSGRYEPGPHSETEGEVEGLIQWYLAKIA